MGMPSAQVAQSLNQQQPAQGKGMGGAPASPAANIQQVDDTMQQIMPAVMPQPQVVPNGQPQGKGSMPQNMQMPQQQQHFGKGGSTNSATSGQPRIGQSNPYPNTIQPWDNSNIQPQTKSGKGKGY